MNELDLLAAAAPRLPDPSDVVPAADRAALYTRITGAPAASPDAAASLDTAVPLDLVSVAGRRRRPRTAMALAAAAAVAALAVAAAVALHPDGSTPTGGTRPAPPPTAVPFSLPDRSGYTVVEAATNPDGVMVAGHGGIFLVYAYASERDAGLLTAGALPIEVNGKPGLYGCLHSDPPPPWRQCTNGEVAWQYRPGAWAVASGEFVLPTRASLLAVARAVDFTHPTPARSPIRLARPPLDGTLLSWDVTYHGANRGETAARLPREKAWMMGASWVEPTNGHEIEIEVFPFQGLPPNRGDRPITISGHHGAWNPGDHRVRIEVATGVLLIVTESSARGSGPGMTLDQFRAIVTSITVTPYLANPTRWFPLAAALPTG